MTDASRPDARRPEEAASEGANLRRKMGAGTLIFVGVSIIGRSLALVSLAVLARLLTPEAFGIAAYAAFVSGFMILVIDRHFEMSMIRMGEVGKARVDTIFTVRLVWAGLLAGTLVAISGPVSTFLDMPELAYVLRAMALVPIMSGLFNPKLILFEKSLSFGPIASVEIAMQAASTAVAVSLALLGYGYWAAVVGMIAASAVRTSLSWIVAPRGIGVGFRDWRAVLAYSVWLIAGSMLNFLNGHVNRIFVGVHLGVAALGRFRLGADLALTALFFAQNPMMRTAYPGLAATKSRGGDMGQAYLRFQSVLMIVMMPLAFGVAIAAPWLVRLVGGPGWQEAVPVLQVLSCLIVVRALMAGTHSLVLLDGRTWLSFGRQATVFVISVPLLWYGASEHGMRGVLTATVISESLAAVLTFLIVVKVAGVTPLQLLRVLSGALAAAAAMSFTTYQLSERMPEADTLGLLEATGVVLLLGAAGAAIYVGVLSGIWIARGRRAGPETDLFRMIPSRLTKA